MMKSYRIASIPGDGIGKEVIAAGIEVLDALAAKEGFRLEFEHFDWSSERYLRTGAYIPDGGLEKLKTFDAIFFGAVGSPGRAGPHFAVGPAPADLPGLRPVRQRPAFTGFTRYRLRD